MKTLRILFNVLFVLFLLSCQKEEDDFIGIHDEWIWIESVGGFGGWTLTPESEKVTRKLVINDFFYKEYVNDSLVLNVEYDLKVVVDTFHINEENTYIEFVGGGRSGIVIGKRELEINDLNPDGYYHRYRRR